MSLGRRRPPVENPIGCPICGRAWLFVTDGPFGLGVIRAVHPAGPCVAPPPVVEEPTPRNYQRTDEAECRGCGETFKQKRSSQLFCDPSCRVRLMARLRVVVRGCPECGDEFRTVYRKQITCSESCRRRHIKKYRSQYWLTVTKTQAA